MITFAALTPHGRVLQVATWGVFERPNDISKAFGGGRTLKPGEALEPEEARTARMQRVSQVPSGSCLDCLPSRPGQRSRLTAAVCP